MPTCFVIQPFDSENNRRYEEVYKPALKEVGLEPYRVDQDPAVEVPIDSIEQRIRDSAICLADITEDNPNVWYELGFAFAVAAPVVMTCAHHRKTKLPFDIQHRAVIRYATASPSDFKQLGEEVAARAKALFTTEKAIRRFIEEPIAPQEGATQSEVIVLAVAAANMPPGDSAPLDQVRKDAERSSLTRAGFHVAVRRLMVKGYVTLEKVHISDLNDSWIEPHVKLSDDGWDWINVNESLFSFIKHHDDDGANDSAPVLTEDDIPF